MKLGVSYNVFDGVELLEASIKCIREHCDFINVVYQTISNFGNPYPTSELVDTIEFLKKENLIDDSILYVPDISKAGHPNEIKKRNIGLETCRNVGCSHFLSIDVDEFYKKEEFKQCKKIIEDNDFDATVCNLFTYFLTPLIRSKKLDTYFVPFIYKIKKNSSFTLGSTLPVYTDPTRNISSYSNFHVFSSKDIIMHHMSWIRKDIKLKLRNWSAKCNLRKSFDEEVNHYTTVDYNNYEHISEDVFGIVELIGKK